MSMTMRAASVVVRTLNRPAVRGVLTNSISRSMASLSGGQAVAQLAKELPHKDAVRYEHKNQKFAFKDIDFHAESLACGFVEQGFRPGDIVLSWLPDHFSEQVSNSTKVMHICHLHSDSLLLLLQFIRELTLTCAILLGQIVSSDTSTVT